jgi:hypothetical protein
MSLHKITRTARQAFFGFAIVAGTSLVTGHTVAAADTIGGTERITLSPSSTTLKVDAGSTQQGSMKVTNDGDVSYSFSVYARPYGVSNELYEPDFTKNQQNTGVYKWVQFDQTKYQIQPGQTVEVRYTLRVPADVAPGGHYGVLFAETDEKGLESTGVARKKRVGDLLYVTVNGTYKTKGNFKEFILPFWQTHAPVVSSARIENAGNADFRAKVSTTAKDLFGRTKYTYTGDPIILPGTTRLVEMKWELAPNFGLFKVTQTVEFLDQKQHQDGYVLMAPKWAPVVLLLLVAVGAAYAVLQRRSSRR